jgi:methyl-accepting chemotaxis protein
MLGVVLRTLNRSLGIVVVAAGCMTAGVGGAPAMAQTGGEGAGPTFAVSGRVALASLMSLSDGHLERMTQALRLLATTDAARSGDWDRVKGPLAEVGKVNVAALNWFALPDGSYWSVQEGQATGSLSTRAYFARARAGQTVMADLVVSKATGKSVAIVAVPVVRADQSIAGVLGASVYLDTLSERLKEEMALAKPLIFYSFDATPLVALHWDPGMIFVDPMELGDEVSQAFKEMLSREQGDVTYRFRGTRRILLYRKSPVTGWWYALGVARPE